MESKSMHWLLGGSLVLVFAIAVATIFVYSQADTLTGDTPSTEATITNTDPVVDSVNIAYANEGSDLPAISLALGATKEVHVWGVVSDANGTADIATTSLVFYRTATGASCTTDKNDCYKVLKADGCSLAPDGDLTKKYDCRIDLDYFTDATDTGGHYASDNWTAKVTVYDQADSGISNTDTTEVNTLLGLNIPTAIAYGTFGLGASTTAANNQEMIITQKGNDEADVEVSGTTMPCSSIGTIPIANQKWALSDVDYVDGAATALSGSASDTDLHVAYRTDDVTANTKSLYWNIFVPVTGVKGVCSGTNTVGVIAQ